jgi:hypothetical protein
LEKGGFGRLFLFQRLFSEMQAHFFATGAPGQHGRLLHGGGSWLRLREIPLFDPKYFPNWSAS